MNRKEVNILEKSKTVGFLKSGIYTFINPYSYSLLRKKCLLENFDFIFVDGISLVKLLSFFKIKVDRVSFDMTSIANVVFEDIVKLNKSLYILGSDNKSLLKFIKVIENTYPNINIVGYRNGFFEKEKQKEELVRTLVDTLKPDVIVVGMGTPLQEKFLLDLKLTGFLGSAYTCGGFIHQTANKINYYPKLFDKFNLRWLYRMYDEPKLVKRYFLYYPKAFFYMLSDLIMLKR